MAITLILASAAMGWLPISQLIRYRGSVLVLDDEGIWFERRGERQGLTWGRVQGYETGLGRLTLFAKHGGRLKLPTRPLDDYPKPLQQILDRRIGPDGERIVPPRPADPLLAKVHDYYGKVPPVEMEPDVIYRQGNRQEIQRQNRSAWLPVCLCIFGGFIFLWLGPVFQAKIASVWILGILCLATGFFTLGLSILRIRRSKDLFVERGGTLFRVRNGVEHRLPAPRAESARRFLGQATTLYGKGPFAYEVSMQFLEPDV